MLEYCESCKKITEHAIIKNRRTKVTAVYCTACMLRKRYATPADKKILQQSARSIFVEVQNGPNKHV